MLPLFRPPLRLYLSAHGVMLAERSGALRPQPECFSQATVNGDAPAGGWTELLAKAGELLAAKGRGRPVEAIIPDLWIHHSAAPVTGAATLGDEELLMLARERISQWSADAAKSPLRASLHGEVLIASLCPAPLLDELKQNVTAAGCRLVGAQGLFSSLVDDRPKSLSGWSGWLLLAQPGMVMASLWQSGSMAALHVHRCGEPWSEKAIQVLERQRVLVAAESNQVRLWYWDGEPPTLPSPWQTVERCRVAPTLANI